MSDLRRMDHNRGIAEPPAGCNVRDYCQSCGNYDGGAIICAEAAEVRRGEE